MSSASVSSWVTIVATTRPIPNDVFTVTKEQENPYLVVLQIPSIIVTNYHISAIVVVKIQFEVLAEMLKTLEGYLHPLYH